MHDTHAQTDAPSVAVAKGTTSYAPAVRPRAAAAATVPSFSSVLAGFMEATGAGAVRTKCSHRVDSCLFVVHDASVAACLFQLRCFWDPMCDAQ